MAFSKSTATELGFEWVTSGPKSKGYNASEVNRTAIRRHATRWAGARKRQNGNKRRHNVGQYPDFLVDPVEMPADPILSLSTGHSVLSAVTRCHSMPLPMPLSGLELLTAESGINILDLSALTETHVGQAVSAFFHRQPGRLVSLLRHQKSSYLSHIPCRYGEFSYLDHAVQTLVAKVREMLDPSNLNNRASMLVYYGRALRTLQSAIDDNVSCLSPDMLCAAELLGLVEVLDSSRGKGWSQHISGAARLIQIRGPEGIQTDYEQDLFLSLVGPIICESVSKNETSFLEEPHWQEALQSLAVVEVDRVTDRGNVTILLRRIMSRLPGLFHKVSMVVCCSIGIPQVEIRLLMDQLEGFRADMLQCRIQIANVFPIVTTPSGDCNLVYELLGTSLVAIAAVNRLLFAVGSPEGRVLESNALQHAAKVLRLEEDMISASGWASFYLNQKASLAASIPATTEIWDNVPGSIIEKWRFHDWCRAMNRKCCCQDLGGG